LKNNDNDIELLYSNPHELITVHQHTIGIIVAKFVYSGLFTPAERDEVIQYVNEKLLSDKIKKMQKQYNRQYYVVTYLSKIIYNLCLEYSRRVRAGQTESTGLEYIDSIPANEDPVTGNIIIEQECRRLEVILNMYHSSRPRIELYMKALFGCGITTDDVNSVFPDISDEDRIQFIERCNPVSDLDHITDKEIYALLSTISNRYDKKNNTEDAIRKWIQTKLSEIINLLNGVPKESEYDKETLKILLQNYYQETPF
jgi:hypothetical protein